MSFRSSFIVQVEGSYSLGRVSERIGLPLEGLETRAIPFAVASIVLAIQLLQILISNVRSYFWTSINILPKEDVEVDDSSSTTAISTTRRDDAESLQGFIAECGGPSVFGFMVARLIGSILLLQLSVLSGQKCPAPNTSGWLEWRTLFAHCPEWFMVVTYSLTTLLSLVSLISKTWRPLTVRCNIPVLLAAFVVYGYRDLWPLATYDQYPEDLAEGRLLWFKVFVLFFTAVIIPLFIPRTYVPVDPKNPMTVVNPEQTSSLFSFATYIYLDEIIWKGAKVKHLPTSELPPLPDSEEASYISKRGLRYLDTFRGAKQAHIFFGLVQAFRQEFSMMILSIVIMSLTIFSAPIGIYHILSYLENGPSDDTIRPWFWVLWLFVVPLVYSMANNWNLNLAAMLSVKTEALLTEVIFEHSLRIRVKAEIDSDETKAGDQSRSASSTPKSDGSRTPTSESSTSGHPQEPTAIASREPSSSDSEASTVVGLQHTPIASSSTPDSNGKGKAKAKAGPVAEAKKPAKDGNFAGKLNNLISTDLNNISQARDFLMLAFSVPLQVTLSMVFLYQMLGWSCFVFLVSTLACMVIPLYVATLIRKTQVERMKATDARVQTVTETVNILRMVKLFGWEQQMEKRIGDKREMELQALWKLKTFETSNGIMGYFIPTLTMILTYATYVVVVKEPLTPSKIFSTIAVFETVRNNFSRTIWQSSPVIQGKVSLDRVGEFLHNTELLDSHDRTLSDPIEPLAAMPDRPNSEIGFCNATFMWSKEEAETLSDRNFKLRVDEELLFKRGCINLIIGSTGSGKSSLLMALLGEMHFLPTETGSWYNLPRNGGVAYAAQESWVLNDTIRNNIVFDSPFDVERYSKVLKQCALERDLELFEAGDQTEVGERGLTLSGGQKARITLARAVYSSAEIVLLDDVLAALDVHTSSWIIEECLKGDLIKGRTVLLVTHNVALASPIADFVVSIGSNGKVATHGSEISVALSRNSTLAAEVEKDMEVTKVGKEVIQEPAKTADGKLVVAEEVAEGHVTGQSMKLLFATLGGSHPLLFFSLCIAGFVFTECAITFQVWFLGYWGSQYETHDPSEVNVPFYVLIYSASLVMCITIFFCTFMYYIAGTIRSSRKINDFLVDSILHSTLRWLDETPTGRIITRCTQDMRTVDSVIPALLRMLADCVIGTVTKLGAIILFTPLFVFPGIGVGALGIYLGNIYQRAQLSVKRESSNAKAPVLSHFSASIHGLVSIRAYGAEKAFKAESFKRINHYIRLSRTSLSLNRWVGFRIDVLGASFSSALAMYLIYGPTSSSSNAGFSLNMAMEFAMCILWLVRIYNDFEVQANSLERIQGYIDIDHEPKSTEAGKPPAAWPTSGDLRVERLSARYSETGPKILHELDFHINSGERIGVVGRTGSGKSSLTLALLRGIITEGTVYYDGIPTNRLNLDALRSNITIIPQIPELLSGSLRHNLDPLEQTDDAALNDALRSAGLFSLQEEGGEARLNLDSKISGGGSNLSVGQRQILALARAMIRGSKVLILDEATSAIDYKTDAIIQNTLRQELGKDVTVITIAHRLQTIMDSDKIMVLDGGRIVEFDQPKELLKKEDGYLRLLVEGSGDKDRLYNLAGQN